jgi:hypothetical protein
MKQRIICTVSILFATFCIAGWSSPVCAQTGTGTGTGGTGTGTGGTGGTNTGAGAVQQQDFTGEQIQIDTEVLADTRRTSINAPSTGTNQAQNPFGGGAGGLQALLGGGGLQGFGQNFGVQQQSTQRIVRAPFRVDFEIPAELVPTQQQVATRASGRFGRLPKFSNDAIQVVANDDGMITLVGTVKSEKEKQLAARQLRLEPGVKKIDNQLQVVEQ